MFAGNDGVIGDPGLPQQFLDLHQADFGTTGRLISSSTAKQNSACCDGPTRAKPDDAGGDAERGTCARESTGGRGATLLVITAGPRSSR